VAPLPKRCAEAMKSFADDALEYGSLHYDKWMDTYEALRVAAARLIGADRSEIAIVKNTSEGIATIAMGMDWRPTDRIVAFKEEFPANYYPGCASKRSAAASNGCRSTIRCIPSSAPPMAPSCWPSASCNT